MNTAQWRPLKANGEGAVEEDALRGPGALSDPEADPANQTAALPPRWDPTSCLCMCHRSRKAIGLWHKTGLGVNSSKDKLLNFSNSDSLLLSVMQNAK